VVQALRTTNSERRPRYSAHPRSAEASRVPVGK
jgi:hypothetical protein